MSPASPANQSSRNNFQSFSPHFLPAIFAHKHIPEKSLLRCRQFRPHYDINLIMTFLPSTSQYSTCCSAASFPFNSSSKGNSRVSKLSKSITLALSPETLKTWARFFSTKGTSKFSPPGITPILFFLSKTPTTSILHFILPCFPVLLWSLDFTTHGTPSQRTVVPGLADVA